MIIVEKYLKINYIKDKNLVETFINNKGNISCYRKDTCFYKYIGMDKEDKDYIKLINNIDNSMLSKKINYIRINSFENITDMGKIERYKNIFENWLQVKGNLEKELQVEFPYVYKSKTMEITLKRSYKNILEMYRNYNSNSSESMIRNLGVKFLGWIDVYFPKLFHNEGDYHENSKVLFIGPIKEHELLFLYFLNQLGVDVLYMNSKEDLQSKYKVICERFVSLSARTLKVCTEEIPDFNKVKSLYLNSNKLSENNFTKKENENTNSKAKVKTSEKTTVSSQVKNKSRAKKELSYEELAKLSSSVVLIVVYDINKKCIGTGSGVVINNKGYILTNFHVVEGGAYYGVFFENEDKQYFTNSVIKYHTENDLALIRIEKTSKAIPVYKKDDIVRGKKVVAIGSPLGLINTVSDGIVSGFREFDTMDMIQFTAPTSPGSSGGALLDMQGNLIGIVTSAFQEGQNLNLAVSNKVILGFVKGFL